MLAGTTQRLLFLSFLATVGFGETLITASDKPPNPIEMVSFSFERRSHLFGSPIFPDNKTDYTWGEVQCVGGQIRYYDNRVHLSDPDNLTRYNTSEYEAFTFNANTILYCQRTIELHAKRPLNSMREAQAFFSRRANKKIQTMRYFKTVDESTRNQALYGMSLLGMIEDRPICDFETTYKGKQAGRNIYVHKSKKGVTYRYEYDPDIQLYTKYTINSAPDAKMKYSIKGGLDTKEKNGVLVFRDTIIHENAYGKSQEKPLKVTREMKIFNLRFSDIPQPVLKFVPKQGTQIGQLLAPSIKYEWHSGQLKLKVDGLPTPETSLRSEPK